MHTYRRVGRLEVGLVTYRPKPTARRPFGVLVNGRAVSAGVRGWRGLCIYVVPAIGE